MASSGLTTNGTVVPKLWRNEELTPAELRVVQDARHKSGRKQFRQGKCFANAQLLALVDPRLSYAEGVAGRGGHHGWNVINGKVVDVTWKRVRTPVLYFGVAFDQSTVLEHWLARAGTPLLPDRDISTMTRTFLL